MSSALEKPLCSEVPSSENVLMGGKVHLPPLELNPFQLQTKVLFRSRFKAKLDLTTRAHNPLPRKGMTGGCSKEPGDSPVIKGVTRGGGNLAVSSHFAFRDGKDAFTKRLITKLIRSCAVARDAPNELVRNHWSCLS
jgi:hypothetical protein